VSQSEARDFALTYRLQASDLRQLAKRQEVEVQWYPGHVGQSNEQVRLSREKAQQLWRQQTRQSNWLAIIVGRFRTDK
jgi:hypothetical protein